MRDEVGNSTFLRSSTTVQSPVFDNSDFLSWFRTREASNALSVRPIPFREMDQWHFESPSGNLVHASGRFFRIEGLRVKTNFAGPGRWDQPIIHQPEIGILGILCKEFAGVRHFLMQAKAEPGNIHTLQLSPTVQATESNYRQVHRGRVPDYLEYFSNSSPRRRLVDELQTEQNSRFLRKRNRNMIVDIEEDLPVLDDFRWLTLGEIKQLQGLDNFVNMDARSVLSCIPYLDQDPDTEHVSDLETTTDFGTALLESLFAGNATLQTMEGLLSWLAEMKSRFVLEIDTLPLSEVQQWEATEYEIVHVSKEHFSVIAVSVTAENREVPSWTQPLLKDVGPGLHGFITQKRAGILHFLVQAKVEPGNLDVVELAPTVACSNVDLRRLCVDPPPFLGFFLDAEPEQIRYSVSQSEEGGRFFQLENRNMILEIDDSTTLEIPDHFAWMGLGQLLELLKLGYLSIDARTLVSCLNWA